MEIHSKPAEPSTETKGRLRARLQALREQRQRRLPPGSSARRTGKPQPRAQPSSKMGTEQLLEQFGFQDDAAVRKRLARAMRRGTVRTLAQLSTFVAREVAARDSRRAGGATPGGAAAPDPGATSGEDSLPHT